ncbi:rolling circle replication-associated protein [Raoultibacter phocaeensis]|uniref:rolling circle replication-associated protein n=1 Tax=Raoultibacter phocaeensis TaxID=2479841 RepID=UPI00111BB653|nr:hypothetical protein [Raoultibacter phocaeensis]
MHDDYDEFTESVPYIKLVDCRHTVQMTLCNYVPPSKARIARVNDDFYYVYSTSELRPYSKGETGTKSDHRRSIHRAFNAIKQLINCNYDEPSHVRFLTLTYAENMRNNKRIRNDWTVFSRNMRKRYGPHEYLYVKEQQGRGAWHLHCVLFFGSPAPWMDNDEVRAIWGHGFVNIQGFTDDINNLGNYLCAYLTDDMEQGKKGGRLLNYESGVRLYNCSRGIKRPVERSISFEAYTDMISSGDMLALSSRDSELVTPSGKHVHCRYELYRMD